jgi:hypothetical protein
MHHVHRLVMCTRSLPSLLGKDRVRMTSQPVHSLHANPTYHSQSTSLNSLPPSLTSGPRSSSSSSSKMYTGERIAHARGRRSLRSRMPPPLAPRVGAGGRSSADKPQHPYDLEVCCRVPPPHEGRPPRAPLVVPGASWGVRGSRRPKPAAVPLPPRPPPPPRLPHREEPP